MFDFYSTTTFFPEATSSAKYRRMKIFRGRVWNEQEVQALISVVYIMEWLKVQHRFFFWTWKLAYTKTTDVKKVDCKNTQYYIPTTAFKCMTETSI